MPLLFLFDEDTRDNSLLNAVDHHNADNPAEFLDVMRVGDSDAPPLSTPDAELVQWAAKSNRIIVSKDKNTLIDEHKRYVDLGNQTPGLLIVLPHATIPAIIDSLALVAHYSEPEDWQNQCRFIPL